MVPQLTLPSYPSFSSLTKLWRAYFDMLRPSLSREDPRHHLSTEVVERLKQLDTALTYTAQHEARLRTEDRKAHLAEILAHYARLESSEISLDEYWSTLPHFEFDHQEFVDAFHHIRFFAETFYLVAWRLRLILNANPPRDFPHLPDLKTPSLIRVRNHLIEHPEHGKDDAQYEQNFTLTDDGIVLKTMKVMLQQDGKSVAPVDHIDRGLRPNAVELYGELFDALSTARSLITRKQPEELQ